MELPNNNYKPSPDVLKWVEDAVGPGATVQSVEPLKGGMSSAVHSVEINYNGESTKFVLRQFTNEEWLKEEPDLALHEAASLTWAVKAAVPTPELVAYDEKGALCGVPTVLMTQLPGSVELKPSSQADNWLEQLAESLVLIHAVEAKDHPWSYFTYNDISRLEIPSWSASPQLWGKAIEIVAGPRPKVQERFIHRDYHPTNVLWQNNRVSGVVDWVNACRGPAGIDVGHCRVNLTSLYGVPVSDQFLEAYRSAAGADFDYHPYWDLISLIETLSGPPEVYVGWVDLGVRHLTNELMKERSDAYLASLMARF